MRIVPLIALFACAASATAQSAASSPRFEAVTIKYLSNQQGGPFFGRASWSDGQCTGGPGTANPGTLNCNYVSFAQLVAQAYHLGPLQFVPALWMESTLFRVEAKIPAGATQEQLPMMERNLLAERFNLAAHFSKAEMVGYEMTVAKGGPKFKAAPVDPKPGKGEQNWVGEKIFYRGRVAIRGARPTMDQLASLLSYYTDRLVVNATGLEGPYDITVDFGPGPADDLRDQLGLVLERTKTIVDVLVVDHAEKMPPKN